MTTILLCALAIIPQPYTRTVVPDGSEVFIDADLGDPNKGNVGAWVRSPGPLSTGVWQQALTVGSSGWNDTSLRIVNGSPQLTRLNDPSYWIAAPWMIQNTKVWADAWVRPWSKAPFGTYGNECWPRAGFEIVGNSLKVKARVIGSPSESLRIVGSDNQIDVFIVSGEQSRLMQDRPAVHVKGDRSRLSGTIDAPMTGAFFDGKDNWAVNLTVYAGSVGDDVGAVYWRRESTGTMVDCRIVQKTRAYPAVHGCFGIYADDRSRVNVINTTVEGFDYGFFGHGGENQRLEGFKGTYKFAPWFLTPTVIPKGNTVSG